LHSCAILPVMRVALISDLHGNQVALDAVLADIEAENCDRIVCLGDTAALGTEPNEVLQTLRDLGCPCIMGNHDEFLINPALLAEYTEAPPIVASQAWCRERMTDEDLAFIRTFISDLTIDLGDGHSLYCFHGSPDSHMDDILSSTTDEQLDAYIGSHRATVMTGGHTHIQMLRQHRGTWLLNPGSVGSPFKEYVAGGTPEIMPYAEYAIVKSERGTVSCELRRVDVDKERLIALCKASTNPLAPFWVQAYESA